jgi:hypothetical protein
MTATGDVSKYDVYRNEIVDDIRLTIEALGCQPILFVGSGLSRRYFGAPSWDELLQQLADDCPNIDKGLGFYKQSLGSAPDVGERFASLYQEWAWSSGKNSFPADMFSSEVSAQSYIKYRIVELFKSITPGDVQGLKEKGHSDEIESLRAIRPHAIITTNYDTMLESIFPDLVPVVGQSILTGMPLSIGEIFKIHGSIEEPSSLVFTRSDYNNFIAKKKYLSAKLLTFFSEHPLIFVGYSASDPNIQGILSDIDEALPTKGGVIPNIYILQYAPELTEHSSPARERIIATGEDRSVRVKLIEASDYAWVFDAFAANPALNDVNPKVLRALVARSYNLVRRDIPKMAVDANFEMLSGAVESDESFAKLFGLANIPDYSAMSATHPYALTEVGKMLGGTGWHPADKLLKKIKAETGIDIKDSDNRYHIAVKISKTTFNKYSPELVALLERVQKGEKYDVDL